MADRPILFSAPMVRAILNGTKTQTRRSLKLPSGCNWYPELGGEREGWWEDERRPQGWWHVSELRSPYGQAGDRLWVRETWAYHLHAQASLADDDGPWVYAADGQQALQYRLCSRWRPSIHMPRHASRIKLPITDVRAERLQNISEADAVAEGVEQLKPDVPAWRSYGPSALGAGSVDFTCCSAREGFRSLWESINGPGSWDANPWVWAIEFKRSARCNEST